MRIASARPAFSRQFPGLFLSVVGFGLVTCCIGAVPAPGAPAPGRASTPVVPARKPIQWLNNFTVAFTVSQKQDKMILAYFSGSDWDEWGQKLEKEVLKTDLFRDWVEANVIPVQIDYPRDKKITGTIKGINDKLKVDYNISKVPTFLFVDPSGEVLARVGYDTMKLREDEGKEQPKATVEFCDSVLKARPAKEDLLVQKTLKDAVKFAKVHALPVLMLVTQNPGEMQQREKAALVSNQQFVRFVNKNLVFVDLPWPAEFDKSPDAEYLRQFAAQWRFGPSTIQLVLWDPGGLGKLKDQITAVSGNPQLIGPLIKRLDADLPNIDYGGGWLEDYKLARAVSHQQKKDLLMAFVSMDGSEWSQKMDAEIFQTPEFKKYAQEGLVLLRVNYPKAGGPAGPKEAYASKAPLALPAATTAPATRPTTQKTVLDVKDEMVTKPDGSQSPALKEQNRTMAEMYGIRGYPTVIVLNPLGQKIVDAKYMKGGAGLFISEMEKARKKDRERRTLISEQEAAK